MDVHTAGPDAEKLHNWLCADAADAGTQRVQLQVHAAAADLNVVL